jgi:hypothetical protein
MSWSAGVYSRGYSSWAADAAASLPISSSKFDQEDNDFAGGLNNCLTKDGLSIPNTAMVWGLTSAQVLALTRGSDGNVFGISRTSGTNNPALAFNVTDATGTQLTVTGGKFIVNVAGSAWLTIGTDGGTTWGNPTGGDQGAGTANFAGSVYVNGTNLQGIPQNLQSGTTYTLVLTDQGKSILGSNASAKTFTIPANSSVAFPIGAAVTFINTGAGAMSIAITTDTLTFSPTGGIGSRSLAQYGVATAIKTAATTWYISGTGLT